MTLGCIELLGDEKYKLLLGDFREVGKQIPDNSIDMIFTDPPYLKDYLYVYPALADFAMMKLKDGGRLITYTSSMHLPEIIEAFKDKLKFVSYYVVEQSHNQVAMLWGCQIMTYTKLLLFYCKGKYKPHSATVNLIASKYQGKKYHGWQQSTLEAQYLITYLSKENQTVCDPMMGGGTTAIPCLILNRKFIGIEIDPKTFEIAQNRIKNSINYQLSHWQ